MRIWLQNIVYNDRTKVTWDDMVNAEHLLYKMEDMHRRSLENIYKHEVHRL